MGSKLSRGIVRVLFANAINLIFNLGTNFLLPKYLSVDSYAQIKTFTLLLTYAGFLHFGYADGMYLKYGGLDPDEVDSFDLEKDLSTMRIFQTVSSALLIILGSIMGNIGVIVFGFTLLPYNMSWYFRNLYQAIGSFSTYSKAINFITIALFICNIGLLFIVRTDYYVYYLFVYLAVYLCTWIFMEIRLRRLVSCKFDPLHLSLSRLRENVSSGFFLMLGNFSSNLLTSMDRWFVKWYLDNYAFAQYSFAVSMESFLNVALTPVTVTLYNFFCKINDINKIQKIKHYVMIFAAFIISSAFWGEWILRIWLTKYMDSINVLYLLFCSQFFYFIIKGIYINLYKSQKRQREYFVKLIIIIIFGFISNYFMFKIINLKESFAIATLASAVLWYILCILDFKEVRTSIQEIVYGIVCTTSFIILGMWIGSLKGFVVYISVMLATTLIFYKLEFLELLKLCCNTLLGFIKKKKA